MSDKRAGARLVDRRSTRRVPPRDGKAHKAPQAAFSNESLRPPYGRRPNPGGKRPPMPRIMFFNMPPFIIFFMVFCM
jgi:hypothetical protein